MIASSCIPVQARSWYFPRGPVLSRPGSSRIKLSFRPSRSEPCSVQSEEYLGHRFYTTACQGDLLFHLFALHGSLMQFGMQKYVRCRTGQERNTYHPWVNLRANVFLIKCIRQRLPLIYTSNTLLFARVEIGYDCR